MRRRSVLFSFAISSASVGACVGVEPEEGPQGTGRPAEEEFSSGAGGGTSGGSPGAASGGAGAESSSGGAVASGGGGSVGGGAGSGGVGAGDSLGADCSSAALDSNELILHLDASPLSGGTVSQWPNQGIAGGVFTPGSAPNLVDAAIGGLPAVRFESGQHLGASVPINGLSEFTLALVSATRQFQQPGDEWCQTGGFSLDLTENGCSGTYNLPIMWGETGDWGFAYLGPVQGQVAFRFGPGSKTYTQPGEILMTLKHDPNVAWKRPMSIGDVPTETIAVKTDSRIRLYVEGVLVVDEDIPGGAGPIKNVSDSVELGSGRREDLRWVGDIAEVVGYARALDDGEVAQLDSYLACKYFPGRVATTP